MSINCFLNNYGRYNEYFQGAARKLRYYPPVKSNKLRKEQGAQTESIKSSEWFHHKPVNRPLSFSVSQNHIPRYLGYFQCKLQISIVLTIQRLVCSEKSNFVQGDKRPNEEDAKQRMALKLPIISLDRRKFKGALICISLQRTLVSTKQKLLLGVKIMKKSICTTLVKVNRGQKIG